MRRAGAGTAAALAVDEADVLTGQIGNARQAAGIAGRQHKPLFAVHKMYKENSLVQGLGNGLAVVDAALAVKQMTARQVALMPRQCLKAAQ